MLATMSYEELKTFEKQLLEEGAKLDTLNPSERKLLEANCILVSFRLSNLTKK
jgi:hypothetical protein